MVCSIRLDSIIDTTVTTTGCDKGIDFFVSENMVPLLASGTIRLNSDGSASGTIEYLESGGNHTGQATCLYRVTDTARGDTFATRFSSKEDSCKTFRITVDETSMFNMNNEGVIDIGLNDVGITLGSTTSIQPVAGIGANTGTNLGLWIALGISALAISVIIIVLLVKRLRKPK